MNLSLKVLKKTTKNQVFEFLDLEHMYVASLSMGALLGKPGGGVLY
jgi:hypothetical protein